MAKDEVPPAKVLIPAWPWRLLTQVGAVSEETGAETSDQGESNVQAS